MSDVGEPCRSEEALTLSVEIDDPIGKFWHGLLEKVIINDACEKAVAGAVDVDSVI